MERSLGVLWRSLCVLGGRLGMLRRSLPLLGRSLGQRAGGQSERAGAHCVLLKRAEGAECIPLKRIHSLTLLSCVLARAALCPPTLPCASLGFHTLLCLGG